MTQRTDTENSGVNIFPSTKKLSIQLSLDGLSFSVLEVEARRLEKAATYWFPRPVSEGDLARETALVMEQFGLVGGGYDQVQLIYQTGRFSLVPERLLDPASLPHYLKLNTRLETGQWPCHDLIAGGGIANVYLTIPSVDQWFRERFELVETRHSGSVLIDALLKQPQWDDQPHCFVSVGARSMELVLIHKQNLITYNIFHFNSPEDFLYYLLMVMEQSELDPEEVEVSLFGQIDPGNPLFKLAHRYIRNLQMLDPEYEYEISGDLPPQQLDFTVISAL